MYRQPLFLCLAIFMLMSIVASGQVMHFHGTIVNSLTGEPVENANLKVANSTTGTATDSQGRFELTFHALPVIVEISCIGFVSMNIELCKDVTASIEISLQPAIHELEGVNISEAKIIPLFKDPDYSLLDYEIMGDNLLLLAYRYQLKNSALLLLSRLGDTLASCAVPETPAGKLYKDPLGYVHYFSRKGNAYQCYYDKSVHLLLFPYCYPVDTILESFADYKFLMHNRLYFQENSPDGFSARIGFYDKANGRTYLQSAGSQKMAKDYYDDLQYFMSPRRSDDTSRFAAASHSQAFELFYKPKSIARMVKAGHDRIAVFDLVKDTLYIVNPDWKLVSASAFSFHKELKQNMLTTISKAYSGDKWKWRWNFYTDDYSNSIYTVFERRGHQKICAIDLDSGSLGAGYELPLLFATKITIYKGEAFFMYKVTGEGEKWRLYKMRLAS